MRPTAPARVGDGEETRGGEEWRGRKWEEGRWGPDMRWRSPPRHISESTVEAQPLLHTSAGPVGAQERHPGPNPVGGLGRGGFGHHQRNARYTRSRRRNGIKSPFRLSVRSTRHVRGVSPASTIACWMPLTRACRGAVLAGEALAQACEAAR